MMTILLISSICWNIYQLIKIKALNEKLNDLDSCRATEVKRLREAIDTRTKQVQSMRRHESEPAKRQHIVD